MNAELNDLDLEQVTGGKDALGGDIGPNKDGALFATPIPTNTPTPTKTPIPKPLMVSNGRKRIGFSE